MVEQWESLSNVKFFLWRMSHLCVQKEQPADQRQPREKVCRVELVLHNSEDMIQHVMPMAHLLISQAGPEYNFRDLLFHPWRDRLEVVPAK